MSKVDIVLEVNGTQYPVTIDSTRNLLSTIRTEVPCPTELVALTCPPCRTTMALTIDRPRPLPVSRPPTRCDARAL